MVWVCSSPWQQACIRNALVVGLTSSNNGTAVGDWMQSSTGARLPAHASLSYLQDVQRINDSHAAVEGAVAYCNAVIELDPPDVITWASQADPIGGMYSALTTLAVIAGIQLALATVYSCLRARTPWSICTCVWTIVLQGCTCSRAGSVESPLVAIDR